MLWKCCTQKRKKKKKKEEETAALNIPANLGNSAVVTGLEKVSFHSSSNEGNAKEYHTIALIL